MDPGAGIGVRVAFEMLERHTLVLGVGNLLLSDEGVGVHVVHRLRQSRLPVHVEVIDGGTAGFELTGHLRGRRKVVIVDAVEADARPGTIFRFKPGEAGLRWRQPLSAHQVGLRGIILQGTATLAFAVRELINRETGGNPTQIRSLYARFSGMVLPGTTIRIIMLKRESFSDGTNLYFCVMNQDGEYVIKDGFAGFLNDFDGNRFSTAGY